MSDLGDVMSNPWHLVTRFVRSLSSAPPPVVDEVWVDDRLDPAERALWTQLGNQDRRHSITVARRFLDRRPDATRAEVAGALLHDIGKIESHLGTFERVAATLAGPRTARWRAYHDHEPIGVELLRVAASDPVTIDLVGGGGAAAADLDAADH